MPVTINQQSKMAIKKSSKSMTNISKQISMTKILNMKYEAQ